MRARWVGLAITVAGLGWAGSALAAHVETSPAQSALYTTTSATGYVAFTWDERDTGCIPCGTARTVKTISKFRFHAPCTKSLTRVRHVIRVHKNNRFSYQTGTISITGKLVDLRNNNFPRFTGTVRGVDFDCDGDVDSGGYIAFNAQPPA
jgi:hypothetical protein